MTLMGQQGQAMRRETLDQLEAALPFMTPVQRAEALVLLQADAEERFVNEMPDDVLNPLTDFMLASDVDGIDFSSTPQAHPPGRKVLRPEDLPAELRDRLLEAYRIGWPSAPPGSFVPDLPLPSPLRPGVTVASR
jgi:hypothetical protein